MLGHWKGIGYFLRRNLDLVTWLYILIPTGLFTYFLLRETVFKLEYGVLEELHVSLIVLGLLLVGSLLKNRLYIEQADQLFLIHHDSFAKLKRWSYWYSLLFNALIMIVGYSLLFPLLYVINGFSNAQMVLLALAMICSYVLCDALDLWPRKWQKPLLKGIAIAVLTAIVLDGSWWCVIVTALFMIGALLYFERNMIRKQRYFHQQLDLDMERGSRFFVTLFSMNKDMQATKIHYFNRRTPKWFKKLYATEKSPTLVELMLKTIWRNTSYLRPLLQLIMIGIPLLILFPLWMKALLIVFCYIGLRGFIESAAFEMKESPVFKLIPYSDTDWNDAIQRAKRLILIPVTTLYIVIIFIQFLFF